LFSLRGATQLGVIHHPNLGNDFADQLSTLGTRTGYAASIAEANGTEAGLAVLDAIESDLVAGYQPYWAVRAHILRRLGKMREALGAYDRAIGLAEHPAVREFLLQKRG
jgi:predicted RNA polymerase sigma factor